MVRGRRRERALSRPAVALQVRSDHPAIREGVSEVTAIPRFVWLDPYRPIDPYERRVDFYEPPFVRGRE